MRRDARAVSHEEQWLTSLKRALVKHGVTADAIAGVVKRAMAAQRRAVGQDGEVLSLGDHHAVQLKAAAMAVELHVPRRAGQLDAARPILHIHAGAKVEMMLFGEVTGAPARPHPDGTVRETAKATEVPKALPKGKAQERGEGWLR